MEQTLTAEMESVLNKLALQMTDIVNSNSDTRIKNLEIISANLNKKIAYSIYAIMKSFSIENGETIKALLLENKENISGTKIESVVTQLTKLISENIEADFLDTLGRHRNQIDAYALSVLLLTRICERAPYILPLDLEHYKALRTFLRKTIKPSRVKHYNIETVDARSSIIQEIKKFNNEFYCSVMINDIDEMILDSRFKSYNFAIIDTKDTGKQEMKSLRDYIKSNEQSCIKCLPRVKR
jgi:5'(3')-deoxyribonucleotidase